MKTCKFMNKVGKEYNKKLSNSSWQPNKNIKCNNCIWCQELEKSNNFFSSTLTDTLVEQNKIDLGLIQAYKNNERIQECLQEFEYLEKELTKPHEEYIIKELNYLKTEVTEYMILYCRNAYADYLIENNVKEAVDEKFIYTKQFMMLAKDVV